MTIKVFAAGGTIDKDYASKAGVYNFEISEPAISDILGNANPNANYEIESLLKKDSLDMTDEDRQIIYDACKSESCSKIIITHGTDTMVETARKLSSIKGKVIIIVGASKPAKFLNSDAPFNIGAAFGAVSILNEGVYIAMNGRIYHWDNAIKNNENGRFEFKNIINRKS